ncbi:MAG: prephenate dehydratase [Solirubrobacteraceae bacterium]|nr:prephenate dehydratase [Solirubrobacteraceae bacterium]
MSCGARARVGFLGPAGTFTEEALLASAAGDAIEPVALASIYETVAALRRADVRWAIVPIENSLDGSVSVTLDLLAEQDSDVEIAGEALLRVRHSLIAPAPIELAEIDTILTHPQVPGQCARFLRAELAHARILPASSTAAAVRTVIDEGQRGHAAIGTGLAASIYGGAILREDIEDRPDNETRFVWLARSGETHAPPLAATGERPTAAECKTSLVFWGRGAESPGWLVRCLDEFARRQINLTKIESLPRPGRLGRYMFFADLNGRGEDAAVGEAIDGLRALCEHVGVLGSYRAAEPAVAPVQDGG